MPKLK
jgi:hypothetical protein